MDQQTLRTFEAKCVQDEAPACQSSCPMHVDARTFVKLMAEGNLKKARIELDKYMSLSVLSAFLCEGDCKKACKMSEIGDAIDMPMLERTCALNTDATKVMASPSNGKKIAIAGSSLSSLCLAWEMAKKGFTITLYYIDEFGKSLKEHAGKKLPYENLEKAQDILSSLKVEFAQIENFNSTWLEKSLEDNLIVYLGEDDGFVAASNLEIEKNNNSYTKNQISLTTSRENVLAGGKLDNKTNFCKAMADAKKAMGSIVRILQKVSPEIAREAEAPYETKLFTNIEDFKASAELVKIEAKDINLPTLEEAKKEASRCVQCSCLECVKFCSYMQHYKTYPKKALREAYNNLAIAQGNRAANTMINSCTMCGLCAKICPNGLNLGDFLEQARQQMVKLKHMPPTAHEFALEDMAQANSKEVQFYKEQKEYSNNSSKYVFFPGCQLPAVLPHEVEKAYAHLINKLEGGVAFHLACCGMPASWAQNSEYLDKHVECIRKEWEERNKPTYIFACASCQAFYQRYLPEMEIISLWEIIDSFQLPEIANNNTLKTAALHDPCTSRDFPKMQESVRNIMSSLKQNYEELELGKENTRCCGFGGLAGEANESLSYTFAEERNKDTNEDLLVYCAICRERMQKVGKKSLHILELLFPQEEVNIPLEKPLLSIYERQENRKKFKQDILNNIWNEKDNGMDNTSKIKFNLADGLEETLSQRKILHSDITRVLQEVEENGASFYAEGREEYLACYRPRQVSYWVKYKKNDNEPYFVLDAYSHRMIVPGVKGEGELPSYAQFSCCK